MAGRVFFWIGIVFLVLFFISLLMLASLLQSSKLFSRLTPFAPLVSVGGNGGPLPLTVGDTPPDSLSVMGNAPAQMDVNVSDTVAIMLTEGDRPMIENYDDSQCLLERICTPTPSSINRQAIPTDHSHISPNIFADWQQSCSKYNGLNACMMQSVGISRMFGSGYDLFASAYLIASGFDVQALAPAEQSANQTQIEWDWNIFSKTADSQIITVGINFHWKPTRNERGKDDIFRQFLISSTTIMVNSSPFFTLGQFTLSSIFTGGSTVLFGGLSIPWIIEQRQKKNEEKKEKNKSQSTDKKNRVPIRRPINQQLIKNRRAVKLAQQRKKRSP